MTLQLSLAEKFPLCKEKKKVDGFYFSSVMIKPADIRFYFFPIYTHVSSFDLSPDLKKQLKGKSCFHLKKISNQELFELKSVIEKGIVLYKQDGLI